MRVLCDADEKDDMEMEDSDMAPPVIAQLESMHETTASCLPVILIL